ncbi:hypothetical protein OHU07_12685 [Streptomyces phaeochromogenes]
MLLNLLPGLRELRSPLACGYIWFLTLWFAAGDHLPTRQEADGPVKAAYDLFDMIGRPAAFACVTFGAYLLGGILEVRPSVRIRGVNLMLRIVKRLVLGKSPFKVSEPPRRPKEISIRIGGRNEPLITNQARAALGRHLSRTVSEGESSADASRLDVDDTQSLILGEHQQLAIRLLAVNPELYNNYDRKRAEAEIRINVGIALAGLIIAVGWSRSWVFAALVIPPLMMKRGRRHMREANDVLIQAVLTGLIESLELSRFNRKVESATASGPSVPSGQDSDADP